MRQHRYIGKYSNKFRCLVVNPCAGCKWYEHWNDTPDKFGIIGWCKRYEPDPDAGYVTANKNPPCLVWSYEEATNESEEHTD